MEYEKTYEYKVVRFKKIYKFCLTQFMKKHIFFVLIPKNTIKIQEFHFLDKIYEIRHNIGPISAAKSQLLLLGQCHSLHRSSAGPTMAAFFDSLSLPTFRRNLAQYRPYTKPLLIIRPCVTFTMANHSGS